MAIANPGRQSEKVDQPRLRATAPSSRQKCSLLGYKRCVRQMTAEIAELHGGSIVVRNLPDAGAEFTVILPLATHQAPSLDCPARSVV